MNNFSRPIYFSLLVTLTLTLTLTFTLLTTTNYSLAKDDDDDDDNDDDFSDKDAIEICCTWGYELADGILSYTIDDNDDDLKDAVRDAVDSWNEELTGIKFVETTGNEELEISFKNDGKRVAGKTVNYFDIYGFIRQSHITIYEEAYDRDFTPQQIEQITKHEIGHVLGLDHANFRGNLMTERVEIGSKTITSCVLEAVNTANAWKIKNSNSIYPPTQKYIEC